MKENKPQQTLSMGLYRLLLTAAFVEGGAVMVVELTGAKMVAPFYGNTIYVWTAVLSVTLGALGLGYMIGGGKYFKQAQAKNYFTIYAISSLFVGLMPIMAASVLEATLDMEIRTGVMTSCLIFLFPPLFCFGLLSPILVRIVAGYEKDSGKAAGKVYAISTFGGIFFTLIAGFALIPSVGLKATVFITAGLTILFPAIYFFSNKSLGKAALYILITGMLIGFQSDQLTDKEKGRINIVYRSEGLHGQLLVAEDIRTQRRVLINNCISQTMFNMQSGKSEWVYPDRIVHYATHNRNKGKVLIGGMGGGLLVNEFVQRGYTVDAVDIDKRLEEVAHTFFKCDKNRYRFVEDDIRHYLNCNQQAYDIIVLDLSNGESQPENVYTLEAFQQIKRSLGKNGILFVHLPDNPVNDQYMLLSSVAHTMKKAGLKIELLNTSPKKNTYDEYMFVASADQLQFNGETINDKFPMGDNAFLKNFPYTTGELLVDDVPCIEKFHRTTLIEKRKEGIKFTTKVLLQDGHLMF